MPSRWGRPKKSGEGGGADPCAPPTLRFRQRYASFLIGRSRRRGRELRGGDDLALQPIDGRLVQRLGFEQSRRGAVEQRAVLLQNAKGRLECAVDELANRSVHGFCGLFAVVALLRRRHVGLQKWAAVSVRGYIAEGIAHAIAQDNRAGDIGRPGEIVRSPGGYLAKDQLLCGAATEQTRHLVLE